MIPLFALAALAACEREPARQAEVPGSTTPAYRRAEAPGSPVADLVTPVRIGEFGANFAACNSRGTTRRVAASAGLPLTVRAAPFDSAETRGQIAPGGTFFICSRSHDQQWLGIVYDEATGADPACGVSAPVPSRRDYGGSCASGWVASAAVKQIAA